jgi:hypothetical protein
VGPYQEASPVSEEGIPTVVLVAWVVAQAPRRRARIAGGRISIRRERGT